MGARVAGFLPGSTPGRPPILARRLLRTAVVVLVIALLPAPARTAGPPTLCIVQQAPVPGLEAEALRVAVSLEKRRTGAAFNRVDAPSLEDCPVGDGNVVLVVGAEDAWWQGADGAARAMELSVMDPRDRASEAARRIVAVLVATPAAADPAIVERDIAPRAAPRGGASVSTAVVPRRDGALQGYLRIGGRYEYQPGIAMHAGAPELEAGVTLLDERLAVGLKGGWQPSCGGRGDGVEARVTGVPVTLMVRGGLRWSFLRVRAGLGAGLEWRRVQLRSPTTSVRPTDSRVFPTLEAELELAFPFARTFRAAVAGTVRGFPSWTDYQWRGRTVLAGPKVGVGCALRLEALFGEGGP